MRILSFQPTATEMAYALGIGRSIVGVSHECTYPAAARRKPVVSRCVFDPESMSSEEIDRAVRESARKGESLYRVDEALVKRLKPDVLLTQSLCDVCAASPSDLRDVLRLVTPRPRVVNLHCHDLEGMFRDLRELAEATGSDAARVERPLRKRIEAVARRTRLLPRKRVFMLEWFDPLYASGHWVPEMVELAGGRDALAQKGKPSRRIEWPALVDDAPEVVVVIACGLPLHRSIEEVGKISVRPEWRALPAVKSGEVYVAEGPSYFNGAGPRLADGVEILAEILHPEAFPRKRRRAWRRIHARRLTPGDGGLAGGGLA